MSRCRKQPSFLEELPAHVKVANPHLFKSFDKTEPALCKIPKIDEQKKTEVVSASLARSITFIVPGNPRGKGRPRFAKRGNFIKTYTDEKTKSYEEVVSAFFRNAAASVGWKMVEPGIPLFVTIDVRFKAAKSMTRRKLDACGWWVTKTPDCDNIEKIILDALNGIAYHDDSQVAKQMCSKRYTVNEPTVMVKISTKETE